jgi:hypothetical protein
MPSPGFIFSRPGCRIGVSSIFGADPPRTRARAGRRPNGGAPVVLTRSEREGIVLFNSYTFVFVFLPLVLAGFAVLTRWRTRKAALAFLILASLAFYAWWNWRFLSLILFSILFNFLLGTRLQRRARELGASAAPARRLLALGIVIAGPIVRFKELVPQFSSRDAFVLSHGNVAKGLFIFAIGLFKKVMVADTFSLWIAPIFDRAPTVVFTDAWGATWPSPCSCTSTSPDTLTWPLVSRSC